MLKKVNKKLFEIIPDDPSLVFSNKKTLKKNNILKLFPEKSVYSFSSARGALSACLDFANVGPDDEVILSSFTCLAVPTAIVNLGAKPVYVDINLNTLNNDVNDIVDLINPRVKAVILQHTFGNSADIKNLMKLLKKVYQKQNDTYRISAIPRIVSALE